MRLKTPVFTCLRGDIHNEIDPQGATARQLLQPKVYIFFSSLLYLLAYGLQGALLIVSLSKGVLGNGCMVFRVCSYNSISRDI